MLLLIFSLATVQAPAPATWLDKPLTTWNKAAMSVPAAPAGDEAAQAVIKRCQLKPPATSAARALTAAGWIPFTPFDLELVRNDVEVIGGLRNEDGMCRPLTYNLFVFVGGRFAGTLSPAPMDSRFDASAGVVRMRLPELTTEFERYTSTDPLCCPSSRMTVTYRIDRTAAGPVVVPVRVVTTRG